MTERERKLAEFDRAIAEARADVAAGRTKPMDEVFDRLDEKYRAMAEAQGQARVRAKG